MKLSFAEALSHLIELFLVGERFSQIVIDSTRNISKNSRASMDNITHAEVAQTSCASSRSKFVGVWSADNFGLIFAPPPTKTTMEQKNEMKVNDSVLHVQSNSIINTSPGRVFGAHWLLLLLLYDQQQQSNSQEEGTFCFCVWDPLGQPVESYQLFYDQLLKNSKKKQNRNLSRPQIPNPVSTFNHLWSSLPLHCALFDSKN